MKKLLIILSSMLLFSAVAAATAIACTHKGDGWQSGGDKTYLTAILLPPGAAGPTGETGATGSTGATTSSKHGGWGDGWHGAGTDTGVRGVAFAKQTSSKLKLEVGVKGLTPGTVYTIGLVQDVDGQGCNSTTNPVLDPPGKGTATANENGKLRSKLRVKSSTFALDLTKSYYLTISDPAGTTVACGSFVSGKKAHRRGHGWGHSKHGNGEGRGHEKHGD